jgi:hypothetical protein
LENVRIAGLCKAGVLTHCTDVESSFGGFIPSPRKFCPYNNLIGISMISKSREPGKERIHAIVQN